MRQRRIKDRTDQIHVVETLHEGGDVDKEISFPRM